MLNAREARVAVAMVVVDALARAVLCARATKRLVVAGASGEGCEEEEENGNA